MTHRRIVCVSIATLVSFAIGGLLAPWISRAEVSIELIGPTSYVVVVGVIEDPDPIPRLIWEPVRDIPPSLVLNASGANREDGRPDGVVDPTSGRPVVIWAWATGADHDIALAEWNGSSWANPSYLTSGVADDVDPRITAAPDGTLWAAWWAGGSTPTVSLASRAPGQSVWSVPTVAAFPGGPGRRPSPAVWQGALLVAFERTSGSTQSVIVATRGSSQSFSEQVVVSTTRTAPLDPVLHVAAGRLWVDWKHAPGTIAWSEFAGGSWGPVQTVPWTDPSFFGEHDARWAVRQAVMAD